MKKLLFTISLFLAISTTIRAQQTYNKTSGGVGTQLLPFTIGLTDTLHSPYGPQWWLNDGNNHNAWMATMGHLRDTLFNYIPSVFTAYTVSSISAMQAYTGAANYIVDTEPLRGGQFKWQSSGTNDNGVIFAATGRGSGHWVRLYQGDTHPEWWGALGDGSTNDFTAWVANYNYMGSIGGGTVAARAGATYIIGSLSDTSTGHYIPLKSNTTLKGNGATIKMLYNNSTLFYGEAPSTNIHVYNLNMVGKKTDYIDQQTYAYGHYPIGVMVNWNKSNPPYDSTKINTNISVEWCHFYGFAYSGVYFESVHNGIVQNNWVRGIGSLLTPVTSNFNMGIWTTLNCAELHVNFNTIDSVATDIYLGQLRNSEYIGNTVSNVAQHGFYGGNNQNVTIADNIILATVLDGIKIQETISSLWPHGSRNILVHHNTENSFGGHGVNIYNLDSPYPMINIKVDGNILNGNPSSSALGDGLHLGNINGLTANDNIITSGRYGLFLTADTLMNVFHNSSLNANQNGAYLNLSGNGTFENNTIVNPARTNTGGSQYGILVDGAVRNLLIKNNNVKDTVDTNMLYSLYLATSAQATLSVINNIFSSANVAMDNTQVVYAWDNQSFGYTQRPTSVTNGSFDITGRAISGVVKSSDVIYNTSTSSNTNTPSGGNVTTVTQTLATQSANKFFAGPSSGSAATPTMRNILAADLPAFVSSITGTADQITASASTGAVTLSLPGNVTIAQSQAGTGLNMFNVSNTDATLGITHVSGFGTQSDGSAGARTIFKSASPSNSNRAQGEIDFLTEDLSNFLMQLGWNRIGSLSLYVPGQIAGTTLSAGSSGQFGVDVSGNTTTPMVQLSSSGFVNQIIPASTQTSNWITRFQDKSGTVALTSDVVLGQFSQTSKTTTYSILTTDYYVDCNGVFTVTLPTAVGVSGKTYVITDTGTSAITVATTGGQTISGAATVVLTAGMSVTVHSDNSNWFRN